MILINATLLLDHFLLCLNFMCLFYVYMYVLYELFFSSIMLCPAFCVNMCACHVYFTINLLTNLPTTMCTKYT